MNVKEHDLPGVGKKFACTTNEGDRLTLIIHNTGHRELYFFERGEDFPANALRLEDTEARKLGALIGGAYFQPAVAESMEMVLGQFSVDWLPLPAGSPLASRNEESASRSTRPAQSTPTVSKRPSRPACHAPAWRTAECSTALARSRSPCRARPASRPRTPRWQAWVPLGVKVTSSGRTPRQSATTARALSSSIRASRAG